MTRSAICLRMSDMWELPKRTWGLSFEIAHVTIVRKATLSPRLGSSLRWPEILSAEFAGMGVGEVAASSTSLLRRNIWLDDLIQRKYVFTCCNSMSLHFVVCSGTLTYNWSRKSSVGYWDRKKEHKDLRKDCDREIPIGSPWHKQRYLMSKHSSLPFDPDRLLLSSFRWLPSSDPLLGLLALSVWLMWSEHRAQAPMLWRKKEALMESLYEVDILKSNSKH